VVTAVATQPLFERLFKAGEFPPTNGTALIEELHDTVLETRQAAFAAFALRRNPTSKMVHEAIEAFIGLPRSTRMNVVADPAFLVWFHNATRTNGRPQGPGTETKRGVFSAFAPMLERCLDRIGKDDLSLSSPVEVVRYDIDPLVATAAPPTFVFPTSVRARELERRTTYSLEFFKTVARTALARIGSAWPELRTLFPWFVRTVVHVPLADFRSASAARYTGVIFLTDSDQTVLEVEESLVHEFGHQLLYRLMELDPIVVDGERGDLTLPWSGARRDFYGYFHALYVYTLLLRYLERIDDREPEEMAQVDDLYNHILEGAVRALPDFLDDSRFTPRGRDLRNLLQHAIEVRADTTGGRRA
jgi:hypothetical protein